jgi:hypothetical protein
MDFQLYCDDQIVIKTIYQFREKRGESREDVGDGEVEQEEVHPGQLLLPAGDGHDAAAVALKSLINYPHYYNHYLGGAFSLHKS